jgi:hypothetical protein
MFIFKSQKLDFSKRTFKGSTYITHKINFIIHSPNIHNTDIFVTQKWAYLLETFLKAIHYFRYNF